MNTQFAERLQKLRKENNFSQEQLADELNVSRQAISKWECGAALPDTENLIALAKLYHCSIDEIVFDKSAAANSEEPAPTPTEPSDPTPNSTENDDVCEEKSHRAHGGENKYVVKGRIVNICTSVTALFSVMIYVLCGAWLDKWHPAWIVFLSIPLAATLAESIVSRNKHIFAFPILVLAVYLMLGCIGGLWHPWWVIFLLIPIYYTILSWNFKKNK